MKSENKMTLKLAILAVPFLIMSCFDSPLNKMLDYEAPSPVTITVVSQTGAVDEKYIMPSGTVVAITFSHDVDGYYQVQVLDSDSSYVSGNMGWIDYTADTEITVNVTSSDNTSTGYFFGSSGDYTVKISGRDLQSRQGVSNLSYSIAPTGSVVVSGAGSTEVNGLYIPDTTTPDFNYFSAVYYISFKKAESPFFYISTDDVMPGSHIHAGSTSVAFVDYYYNFSTSMNPPASTGWNTATAADAPAPTVSD